MQPVRVAEALLAVATVAAALSGIVLGVLGVSNAVLIALGFIVVQAGAGYAALVLNRTKGFHRDG
jgi:hypothetical protein